MASNTTREDMERAILEVARRHREQHIDKFKIQLEALKGRFPNMDNPLLNLWLSYSNNPENLQQLFPEVQAGSPIPSYLLTSRNFTLDLEQAILSLNERAPGIDRPHRRLTTRLSRTSAQAGGGSGPTPDQPESSTRGRGIPPLDSSGVRTDQPQSSTRDGDNPALNSTGVRNDASQSPLNFNSESTFDFNNESIFGFSDLQLDGNEDGRVEWFGSAQGQVVQNPLNSSVNPVQDNVVPEGNVVQNPLNSSLNPVQDNVVPEVEVNTSSPLNHSHDIEFPDIEFPEVDSPLGSDLSAGQRTNTPQDEADDHGAIDTAEGDADPIQQGATADTTSPEAGSRGDADPIQQGATAGTTSPEADSRGDADPIQQGATAGTTSPEAGLNVEYAGYEAHHIPNSNVFGAQHALEAKLLKFTKEQYACMVMNGQKFDLPENIDRLRVDLCYRNDGSTNSDVETGWGSRGAANIKLGETEIEVRKYVYAHWVKWVFKRDDDVIIHYLSSGREKRASVMETIRKDIEELNKTLALRKEELRKLEEES